MKNVPPLFSLAALLAASMISNCASAATAHHPPAHTQAPTQTQALQARVTALETEVAALRRQMGASQPKTIAWNTQAREPMNDGHQASLQPPTDCSLTSAGASSRVVVGFEHGIALCAPLTLR
ncbi:MAG TPA: hypothetical protein VGN52_12755 [Burkholderiales bacterium]|jgi:outer membrane murein-binding lipoprotein Lpp